MESFLPHVIITLFAICIMSISIDYIPAPHLQKVKQEWNFLENGLDMTLFQSFDWNNMLLEHYVPKDTNSFESLYALVKIDGKECLIAPLWIVKKTFRLLNKKGIYLLGRDSYSDYLNLIYNNFNSEALDFLLKDLHDRYHQTHFIFEHLNEKTSIYQHIVNSYTILDDKKEPCVDLQIPPSLEEYHKLLSKHSRQNLRTANNRLNKDGLSIIFNMDNSEIDKGTCLDIRESKLSVQYEKISKIRKYKYRMVNRLLYHFPRFTPITTYKNSMAMTATIDNKLCAFFHYAYDEPHKRIVIISAGTDLTYARYSPGMLLMYNFIKQIINEQKYQEIDFTRGDESYKFALGGKLNYNHMIKFHL